MDCNGLIITDYRTKVSYFHRTSLWFMTVSVEELFFADFGFGLVQLQDRAFPVRLKILSTVEYNETEQNPW